MRVSVAAFRHGYTLYLLDSLAIDEHHDTTRAGYTTAQRNKQPGRPGRAIVPVVVVHVETQSDLKERVPHVHPNDKVHVPGFGWRRMSCRGWGVGDFGVRDGNGRVFWVQRLGLVYLWQVFRAGEAEPSAMYASKSSDANFFAGRTADPPESPPVEIAEPPRSKTEARYAEERVEDLRVYFDPYPAGRL